MGRQKKKSRATKAKSKSKSKSKSTSKSKAATPRARAMTPRDPAGTAQTAQAAQVAQAAQAAQKMQDAQDADEAHEAHEAHGADGGDGAQIAQSPSEGREGPSDPPSRIHDGDLHLFNEGTHLRLYEHLGGHLRAPGEAGATFAVWAPNAAAVAVVGDFNRWDPMVHPLRPRGHSGIWEGYISEAREGDLYKYWIRGPDGDVFERADPLAIAQECPPQTASILRAAPDYAWGDGAWMASRAARQAFDQPLAIYEVHLGSWMRVPEEGDRWLTYRELAPRLADYVSELGFTHVELMPLSEHPFYGSWGYQITGYFAPTARYGDAEGLMFLIDTLHRRGIGVILDWVPAHFPGDAHGLAYFDGTHLYEHEDPRRGLHPDWDTMIFNYGRHEVRAFLLSSALYWLDRFHIDGLRVDAVASMLYLDYSRPEGQWLANVHGGRENLEAIELLRRLGDAIRDHHPGVHLIAEESTAWPKVSRPAAEGGLGFDMKWDMGWMHDTLRYLGRDPLFRQHHHREVNFRLLYAYAENFILPLSHDEVVHGKGALLAKMQGDHGQRLAHLRLLFGYMFGSPGKKLLFMGGEFAQLQEWNHDRSLDWHLLSDPAHAGVKAWVAALARLYRGEPALHQLDHDPAGFCWIDADDAERSLASFLRLPRVGAGAPPLAILLNFTPVARHGLRVGVPQAGPWEVALSSAEARFSGRGFFTSETTSETTSEATSERSREDPEARQFFEATETPWQGMPASLTLDLPGLAAVFLRGPAAWAG